MKDPCLEYLGDRPYNSYEEYLEDEFAYQNVLILEYLKQHNVNGIYDNDICYFNRCLSDLGLLSEQDTRVWKETIYDRLDFDNELSQMYPIIKVCTTIQASDFEKNVILIALRMYIDTEYSLVINKLNNNNGLTLELAQKIYCINNNWSVAKRSSYILKNTNALLNIFTDIQKSQNIFTAKVVCDAGLAQELLGNGMSVPICANIPDLSHLEQLLFKDKQFEKITNLLSRDKKIFFYIWGDNGIGKKQLIYHIARHIGCKIIVFSCRGYKKNIEQMFILLRYAVRDCNIYNMSLVITDLDDICENSEASDKEEQQQQISIITNIINICSNKVKHLFMTSTKESQYNSPEFIQIQIEPLNETQRTYIWEEYLGKDIIDSFELKQLANTFVMTPGQIKKAIQQSYNSTCDSAPSKSDLYTACYKQLNHFLSEKTTKVKPAFSWDDLKMDDYGKSLLKDICNCVRNRHIVMNEWGFQKVVPYGAGVTALFAGPPGTGKTMAVQVIANELQMELYKVDLSQLIDKYVGETEKNIKNIFNQAKKSNSILFFDEADAIFNKRMQAKDANERFANIESSLLLQCIEEFNGITILATNNMDNIDFAFIRRFKFYLFFKEPDENVRYLIWKSVIPKNVPLSDDIDLKALAKTFDFTGAIIKNIALASAYYAAEENRQLQLLDILKAIWREMAKNNRTLTREDMAEFGYLYNDLISSMGIKNKN